MSKIKNGPPPFDAHAYHMGDTDVTPTPSDEEQRAGADALYDDPRTTQKKRSADRKLELDPDEYQTEKVYPSGRTQGI